MNELKTQRKGGNEHEQHNTTPPGRKNQQRTSEMKIRKESKISI